MPTPTFKANTIRVEIVGGQGAPGKTAYASYVETTDDDPVLSEAAWSAASGNVAGDTHAATSKATPVDADEIPLADSAASFGLKKLTWANLKATAKTYFDTLYATLGNLALKSNLAGGNTITGTQVFNSDVIINGPFSIDSSTLEFGGNIGAIEYATPTIAGYHRAALGLGTLATQSGTFSGTSSGTNTGDQTSIVGITGTKAEFNTAATDGDFYFLSGDLGTPSNGNMTNCGNIPLTEAVGQLASINGGTENSYTKFTGPTTAQKIFTLPNANATLLYSGMTGTESGLTAGNATLAAGLSLSGGSTIVNGGTNIVSVVNGTSAQALQVYNTSSGAGANYERFEVLWSGNSSYIRNINGGTGALRSMFIGGDVTNITSGSYITLGVAGTNRAQVASDGLHPWASATSDLGRTALKWRDGYFSGNISTATIAVTGAVTTGTTLTTGSTIFSGGSIQIPATAGFQFLNRGWFIANADGVFQFGNSAVNDFSRLQLGGTTSSFPAIKRSSTTLAVRLADDSADAPITASNGTLSGTLAVTGTSTLGVLNSGVTKTTGFWTGTDSASAPTSRTVDINGFAPHVALASAYLIRWESTSTITAAHDVGLGRNAAGVLEVNNGTAGGTGHLKTNAAYIAGSEMTAPAAPAANGYRIYAEDNGSGKTRLMVIFATGAAQQIAIEP